MPGVPFDCHGDAIALPAELEYGFTAPPSFIDFHEVIEKLKPALKQICTHARHLPYSDDFIIADFVNFISRKTLSNPGKCYWERYNDGPRKYAFAHWVCICFMAHLQRPETKAKLKRHRQAIDTQLRETRAAGRKRFREFLDDPHERNWKPPPASAPSAAEQTPQAIIEEAKGRAKKIIEEAQAEAVRIKANAHRPARDPGQFANPTIFLNLNADGDPNNEKDTN